MMDLICRESQLHPSPCCLRPDNMCLSTVCPTRHRQFDKGYFVLVPSEGQRRQLLDHENTYFSLREATLSHGEPDPGRTFPMWVALQLPELFDLLNSPLPRV
jgi:hypothetical protein